MALDMQCAAGAGNSAGRRNGQHPRRRAGDRGDQQESRGGSKAGEFREDLFYRIAAFPIVIPPLRDRREDIPALAKHFLQKHTKSIEKSINGTSAAALRLLLQL